MISVAEKKSNELRIIYNFVLMIIGLCGINIFCCEFQQRNYLITIGEDERSSPLISPICLKIFDLDKTEAESSSAHGPVCVQILRIFTNQYPEAKVFLFFFYISFLLMTFLWKVFILWLFLINRLDINVFQITSFLALEEAPPQLLISIGLENGSIYCIEGDFAREKIVRFKLEVEGATEMKNTSITGLGFKVDGHSLQLFAVTPISVSLITLQKPPRLQTLDQIGCGINTVSMNDRSVCCN